ncbi:alpha/beta fold hydrolase [Corallococcus exiguus]|uniref:alpha/beta fold hydrolase n=1 Tax=Corallococcus exiguus TaxID=83462 RepID=UPI001470E041|nr:alpha/beta fold hydrolase [Corallococcus exiguus]NNB88901.1 alpha/beta fold hydrolase [Corallococcus exiguus]NNC05520.1 alpha/beta fold hydrolase [Corallococcus exiguus]
MSLAYRRRSTLHRGCTLSWFVEGDGPPVVMIQGVGVGATGWRPQVEGLASHFRCLCLDNRGFGASQPPGEALTVELMADDVLALMDAQGWKSAHIMGHSLGGLVALYLAHQARERVRSLALLCTFATGAVPTRLTPGLLLMGLRTQVGTRRMRRHAFLRMVLAPEDLAHADKDALAEQLAELFDHDLADQPPVAMRQFRAMRSADATPFLQGLAGLPTLVVSATHDPIAPPTAGQALAAGIPGARFVELPHASHGVPLRIPDRVNALLKEHLDAAEGSRQSAMAYR